MASRPGRSPFKNQPADQRYKPIIEAVAGQHPMGTWAVIPVTFPDVLTARQHANMLYRQARMAGYGRQVHYIDDAGVHHERHATLPDGPVQLKFRLFSKEQAQAYVAAGREGKGLAYNTRRTRKGK